VNVLLIALLAAFLAAKEELKTHTAPRKKAPAAQTQAQADAVQQEYEKILEKDESALQSIEKLVAEFEAFSTNGAPGSRGLLIAKVDQLIDGVKKSYNDFLQKHPKHVDAYLAYGSFLNEVGEEEEAVNQWEKAREIDPNNPSPWNNLANIYGHHGPPKKAFQYYEKAIELDPTEPVYLQNLATTVYLFRKDAVEMYRIDEEAVFNKALDLYRQAMKLDPTNLVLAIDYAQSYYGIRPMRVKEALAAWEHCLGVAKNDVERQGIYLHLARVELNAGMFEPAQKHLDMVNHPEMQDLKARLQRNLDRKRSGEDKPDENPKDEPKKEEAKEAKRS
jgi:tetratricopeptide (TPR) repeat protein